MGIHRKLFMIGILFLLIGGSVFAGDYNYARGLQYTMHFYDANKCGPGITGGRLEWRGDCHVEDVLTPLSDTNLPPTLFEEYRHLFDPDGDGFIDVSGGYHDAGDHIRFGIPTTYAGGTLAWGLYEFKDAFIQTGQYDHIIEILRHFADDYFKNVYINENGEVIAFCYMVGNGSDHNYWGSPELQLDTDYARPAFFANQGMPASDVAGGAATVMALTYLNFLEDDPEYAEEALVYAKALYEYGVKYRGTSSGGGFYSSSYDADELSWGAVWLYVATGDYSYIEDIISVAENGVFTGYLKQIIATTSNTWQNIWVHCWDTVWGGVFAKLATLIDDPLIEYFCRWNIEYWSGGTIPHEDPKDTDYLAMSPSGYTVVNPYGSARYNTAAQLQALTYAKYRDRQDILDWAKSQMDYILGDNPMDRCYVVGYSENSAKHPHHRAAHGSKTNNMDQPAEHKHTLWGALVGGPDLDDYHTDVTSDYVYNEVAIDYNAAVVGAMAGLYTYFGDETHVPDENFPPKEPEVLEIFTRARLEQENGERTQITVTLVNETVTPPILDDQLHARYFFNISEMIEAGQTVEDVKFEIIYDQNGAGYGGPITSTGPVAWDAANGIYYIDLSWKGYQVYGERMLHFALIGLMDSQYNAYWDHTNDWSRQGITEEDAVAEYICVYSGDQLVFGELPPGPEPTPTPGPSGDPNATPTPTPEPVLAANIQYECVTTDTASDNITFRVNVKNTGTAPINYGDMKIRYYFTPEGGPQQVTCDYAVIGTHLITYSLVDDYIEVGFSDTLGTIAPGASTGEIKMRMNNSDWSVMDQSNDYSFDGSKTAYAEWDKITVYVAGEKVWGIEDGEPVITPNPTPVPPTPTPTPVEGIVGDANGNGSVDIIDALLSAQYSAGLPVSPDFNPVLADVNESGSVDIVDALMIARFSAGLITSF